MAAGPWDNVQLPSPPNGPAYINAGANLFNTFNNAISGLGTDYQQGRNFAYQQAQQNFFRDPNNLAALQQAMPQNQYSQLISSLLKAGGTPAISQASQLLPTLQRQQLIEQYIQDQGGGGTNATQPTATYGITGPQPNYGNPSPPRQSLSSSTYAPPRIGYGIDDSGADSVRTLTAQIGGAGKDASQDTLQRFARSVGASGPDDDLTPQQVAALRPIIGGYFNRTSGGVQGGGSPDRGGANNIPQPGTGDQESQVAAAAGNELKPSSVQGGPAISPAPTSGSGRIKPTLRQEASAVNSGTWQPTADYQAGLSLAQPSLNSPPSGGRTMGGPGARYSQIVPGGTQAEGGNPPSGAAAMVPQQFRQNPQAFADMLHQQADDLRRRNRLGELIGISSKTAEDRANAYDKRADQVEAQIGKDVERTGQQKEELSGTAAAAKQRELRQTRYDKTDQGIEAAARSADQMSRHLQTMDGILESPNLFTGAGQANVNWLRQMAQNFVPGYDPNRTLPNEALRKVTAQNLQNQVDTLRADAQEMGGSAGRIMLAQIKIMQDAAQNPDNSIPALRYLTEIGHRAVQENRDISDLARDYKAKHNDQLDSGFDKVLSNYERSHPMLTPQEERNINMVASPRMPTNIQNEEQAKQWARQHGLSPGDPIRINKTYPAQYIHAP